MKWISSILLAWTLTVTSVTSDVTTTAISFTITDPDGATRLSTTVMVPNSQLPRAYDLLRARFNQAVAIGQGIAPKPATITQGMKITNEDFPQ